MDPLRISMVGLSRWESVFVQTSVDLASGMEITPCRFVDDPQGADVLLVDADHHRYVPLDNAGGSRRPVVVSLSTDPTSANNGRGLMRPVGYAELISVLKDIEHELHELAEVTRPPQPATKKQAPAGPAPRPAADMTAPVSRAFRDSTGRADESLSEKARPARRFVEGTRLLGILNRISKWGIPAEVTHSGFPTLLVIPGHNTFVSSGTPLSTPAMFRDSAMSFEVRDLAEDVAEAVLTSEKLRPLSHLIYCAALFGSEGRLMLNSNPQDRLSLIGTPDFDAVPHLPEHKTIARYLIANAADLADIARSTGVSISMVIDFCNACEAAGLVRRIPDGISKRNVDEHGVLQLFGRVRDLFKDT